MPRVGGSVVSAPAPAAGDTKEVSSPKRRRTAAGKDNLKTKSLQVNEQEGVDTPAASPVSKRKKAKKDKEPKEPLKEPPKELPEPKEEPPEEPVTEDPAADPFAGLEAQLEGLVDTAEELPAPKIEVSQDRQTEALKDAVAEGAWFSAETFEDLLPERYRESLGSPHQDLIELVMSSHTWWRPGLRSLVKNLADLNQVTKSELPKKMDALDAEKLAELLMRMQAAVEKPLYSFSDHLKPALARRIHVGTMDYMGGSHESYRRTFEFIEMTNTWHDVDKPTRDIGDLYRKKLNCSYKDPAMYKALAARAADKRDSFRMVVKVSCVATHLTKLQNVLDWWPALWQEKYQYLAPATVAFLWQFPPSFVYSDELYQRFERLVEFLSQEGSGIAKARHIVDFRDGSWYRQDVYDFLRQKRWCLAWLHLNNATGWASNLPSGWTDRVQTTNFCFCRLFGPDGQTHGTYDNKFLHELFDSCPRGTTTYVLFGNKEVVARRNVGHRNSIEPPHRSFETFPSCAAMASSGFESGNDDAVEALLFSVTVEERLGWTASAAGVHEDLPDGASEETVTQLLEGLTVGSRISFRGLGKEDRALVHSLAHRLPGLSKSSRADPDAEGQRMVCVERVAPSTAAAPAAAAKPEPDADPVLPRRSRWRRAAGVVTEGTAPAQLSDDALRATAGYPHLEERKPTPSAVPVPTPSRPASLNSAVCKVKSLCIVWLRDDMRLEDNPALFYAAQGGFDAVLPLFILEPDTCHPLRGAGRFWKHQSLRIFTSTLHRLGSCLVLRRGNAVEEIPRLLLELGLLRDLRSTATVRVQLSFNRRGEPWHQSSDQEVASRLRAYGIEVESYPGNVLYEPQDLQPIERWQRWRARVRAEEAAARGLPADSAAASGKPKQLEHISGFGSYRFFSHALEELGPPPFPLGTVDRLPRCPGVASEDLDSLGLGETSGQGFTPDFRQSASHKSGDWAAGIRSWWKVGEAAANERLAHFLDSVLAAGDFEGRKRLLCHERNTSELSPYIRFGEISARKVYWAAKRRRERTNQKLFENPGYEYVGRHASYQGSRDEATKANATFLRRFIWRDLSYWFLWQFPSLPRTSLRPQYEEQTWSGTRRQLRHWQRGSTGFPLVDAAMRQLWAVGWMPNYLRHVVAQMLIEYLDLTWKHGLEWFDWTLVDIDVAINSFMWQNGGHSGPDHWEFVLHPVNAAKSCDPEGHYVRRWLPFLAGCPTEYIHRPWEMPLRVARPLGLPKLEPLVRDLDAARRAHCRQVLEVRRKHPEMVSRTGHEWLRLGGGLLAKLVTRQEFRAETEDFIFYQGPRQKGSKGGSKGAGLDAGRSVLAEEVQKHESDTFGPGL
ncbi:CRY2 [Symbiodinium microadriaticum]|nr:CRY2 [Symbiodinium microadriaticum]